MKLVFATNNKNKLKEVQEMLTSFDIISLKEIGCFDEIPETANTLDGNAKIKANYITNKFNVDCFADDTGLEVEALHNAPGVYSARYAGGKANAEENIKKLLKELKGKSNRNAQFRTVITLNLNKKQFTFEGICKGQILLEKKGINGFGYDPVFKPTGFNKSFAEMNLSEKSSISHRGKAVKKLVTFLNKIGNSK